MTCNHQKEELIMRYYEALKECIENGKKITRKDWNGKGMHVYYVPAHTVDAENWAGELELTPEEKERRFVYLSGHFDMYNAQGIRIIGWTATQTDMASDKWEIVE